MAAQVVLRWHFQNGVVAIPKSVHAERIAENMASQAKESDAKAIFIELAGPSQELARQKDELERDRLP